MISRKPREIAISLAVIEPRYLFPAFRVQLRSCHQRGIKKLFRASIQISFCPFPNYCFQMQKQRDNEKIERSCSENLVDKKKSPFTKYFNEPSIADCLEKIRWNKANELSLKEKVAREVEFE